MGVTVKEVLGARRKGGVLLLLLQLLLYNRGMKCGVLKVGEVMVVEETIGEVDDWVVVVVVLVLGGDNNIV